MKKAIFCVSTLVVLLLLAGCGILNPVRNQPSDPLLQNNDVENRQDEGSEQQNTAENTKQNKVMTPAELEAEISKQQVKVISTEYIVQDDRYKSLYPDLLSAVIENGSEYDIKDAVVAYVAWDKNNLPVMIETEYGFGSSSYVVQCDFDAINLIPGEKFGKDSGLALDSDMDSIDKFKAIVKSYETFDGETWDNPLFNDWKEVYEGKRYSE